MFSPFCRFNDDQSIPSKYSVGRLQRRRKEDDHWLVANRKAEQQRNRNELRRIKEVCRNECIDTPHGGTLDADFLLRLHYVTEPSQLCSINISERKLNSVSPEDLKLFTNVAHVDASINSLTLGSFSCLKFLRELSLALNGIRDMTFDAADFPHLKVLDLSFNHVSVQGLVSLALLPSLQTLHLTGNQLHRLPHTFGSSDHDQVPLPGEEGAKQFEALEVLMLDNNKLTFEVFHSLTNLTKLKYLNLQGNRISAIPLLKVGDGSKPEQLSAEDEVQFHSKIDEYLKILQTKQTEDSKGCSLPLPELQHLNLAENKFSTEEDLIGTVLFPKLSEIIIHSNPLITKKKGLPMLTYYLQERRGIEIKRNKAQNVKKNPLKWKVEENFRKMSKEPCLTDPVYPRETQNDKNGKTIQETTLSEGRHPTTLHKDKKHFFIIQGEDKLELELVSSSKKQETTENNKTLQNTEVNPDVLKSVGIQTAVRMLEHRLRNLNVYRDSKPKLDSIQTPYRQREKKIKELPPIRPKNRSSRRTDEMMKDIKASTAITITPLAEALSGKCANRKEAQSLLKDLQRKHQMLFEKAWALTDQI